MVKARGKIPGTWSERAVSRPSVARGSSTSAPGPPFVLNLIDDVLEPLAEPLQSLLELLLLHHEVRGHGSEASLLNPGLVRSLHFLQVDLVPWKEGA